ncbi:hypothetical protein ABIA99_001177 [Bradyrhizobium sp. LB12.1]|uniref:hypothetical protein n=1 Tax=Bradyrhizobium sp. LB12.1 TaxID=3156327 RepID=UPI0033931CF2
MRPNGVRDHRASAFRATKSHDNLVASNLIKRGCSAETPVAAGIADIYRPEGRMYVAVVMDPFSLKIIH